MTGFKKYVLRPLYIVLDIISVCILLATIVLMAVCWYEGVPWSETYKIFVEGCSQYSLMFLGAYYIKWEFVYGPQKKQDVKK